MNQSVAGIQPITPAWNEERRKILLILAILGIISNTILIAITFATKNLFKDDVRNSGKLKCDNATRKAIDKAFSSRRKFYFFLSKCCSTSNHEEQIVNQSRLMHSCYEFDLNCGCCVYKTEFQSYCISKYQNITPAYPNIELDLLIDNSKSEFGIVSTVSTQKFPQNLARSPGECVEKYSLQNQRSGSQFQNEEEHVSKCDGFLSNPSKNDLNIANMRLHSPTILLTEISDHFRCSSSSANITEYRTEALEKTSWQIFRFLIQILAFAQIGYLIFENLLPWISNLLIFHLGFSLKLKLNINCRLKRMFGTFFLLFEEWSLLLFGIERVCKILSRANLFNRRFQSTSLYSIEDNRRRPQSLCLKLSTGLFIAVIFAALSNYLWVFGQLHLINSVKYVDSVENVSLVEAVVGCNVRSEYFRLYYTFLIYMDPLFSFIIPHLCSATFFIVIILQRCLGSFCCKSQMPPRTTMAQLRSSRDVTHPQTTLMYNTSIHVCTLIDQLSTILYLLDTFLVVSLKFWRNIEKTLMVFFRITLNTKYLMIRNELYHLVFCLVPMTTVTVYLTFYYRIRRCFELRQRALDV